MTTSEDNFTVQYNSLPLIRTAHESPAGKLFDSIRPKDTKKLKNLFSDGNYALCLLYRHYHLRNGERIITNGNIVGPFGDKATNIVPERWNACGEPLEYRFADLSNKLPSVPSKRKFSKLRHILRNCSPAIDYRTIGICFAPAPPEGCVFLQSAGIRSREQVFSAYPKSYLKRPRTYPTTWAYDNTDNVSCLMACTPAFDSNRYNALPRIGAAQANFETQPFTDARITRGKLFRELAEQIFIDKPSNYGVCLAYCRFPLRVGERMVADCYSIGPSADPSQDIVPIRWLWTGEAIEYMRTTNPTLIPDPPSPEMFAALRKLIDLYPTYPIKSLGICYDPSIIMTMMNDASLEIAQAWLETTTFGKAEVKVTTASAVRPPDHEGSNTILISPIWRRNTYHTAWIPVDGGWAISTATVAEKFSLDRYNNLPLIHEANQIFENQLDNAPTPVTRQQLFEELGQIFDQYTYGICLLHRHYLLRPGERIVTEGESTKTSSKPCTDITDYIITDRWYSSGDEMEHVRFNPGQQSGPFGPLELSPPDYLFVSFRKILDQYGINILGLCRAPDVEQLQPDEVYLETLGPGDREVVTSPQKVDRIAKDRNSYEVIWVVDKPESSTTLSQPGAIQPESMLKPKLRCCSSCNSHVSSVPYLPNITTEVTAGGGLEWNMQISSRIDVLGAVGVLRS